MEHVEIRGFNHGELTLAFSPAFDIHVHSMAQSLRQGPRKPTQHLETVFKWYTDGCATSSASSSSASEQVQPHRPRVRGINTARIFSVGNSVEAPGHKVIRRIAIPEELTENRKLQQLHIANPAALLHLMSDFFERLMYRVAGLSTDHHLFSMGFSRGGQTPQPLPLQDALSLVLEEFLDAHDLDDFDSAFDLE